MPPRSRRAAAVAAREAIAADGLDTARMSFPRNRAFDSTSTSTPASASLSREPPSSPSNNGSLRLTVKMQPNKLRAATTGGARPGGTRGVAQKVTRPKPRHEDSFEPAEILETKRKRSVKKSYVVESESEDEDVDMDDVADDDVEEESALEDDMDVDEDAEGEDDDDDAAPPPPVIKSKQTQGKPILAVKPQPAKKEVRPVETKEMADSDDDELSELESDMEDETMMGGEEDAEGDEEEIEVEEDEEEEEELDSDLDTPGGGSRASTPDLSKLTKRQRARLDESASGYLMALPDGMWSRFSG